jgi:hypothetical protein
MPELTLFDELAEAEAEIARMQAIRSAVISDCGLYRYRLDRRWSDGPTVAWLMLNPSTADARAEDATSRRIQAFSRSWGYGALTVVNLYAWRATDPRELWRTADPVGPDNDRHITEAVAGRTVIAAWGANARPDRITAVLALPGMDRLHALELTKDGQPRHPLYLRRDLTPQPWRDANA